MVAEFWRPWPLNSDVMPVLILCAKNQINAGEGGVGDLKCEENLMHYHWLEDKGGHVSRK